ncbi:hypothetical protein CALVIDRAFT_594306 [Calocera viscosa TUFC12733]|uniref:N-acetyltransferase domain-containing protein n=1 Tax=Calocera viscosa (strain TUFC12733) TaxID=1330018 RepID=A0A167S5M1_CALVF|nr:hypothetical protein CALVIDRAFT_594306 [Calocera viscosa TUFC12733]
MEVTQPKKKRRKINKVAQAGTKSAQPANPAFYYTPTQIAGSAAAGWPYYYMPYPAWGNGYQYAPPQSVPGQQQIAQATPSQSGGASTSTSAEPVPQASTQPDLTTMQAMHWIRNTPFQNSFASRLMRSEPTLTKTFTYRDWESRAPWMDVMDDIYLHYRWSHPDEDPLGYSIAPIDYAPLSAVHLPQVHALLGVTFWPGISVSDSVLPENEPDKCTVVATYKRLVVGVALLSDPREGYLMYLAVKAGWDAAGIATTMLHMLVVRNQDTDITLHVSANNPAMLLYNRFGFKAEEFVVGFYDEYLPRTSRAGKNAFRLRLRR